MPCRPHGRGQLLQALRRGVLRCGSQLRHESHQPREHERADEQVCQPDMYAMNRKADQGAEADREGQRI